MHLVLLGKPGSGKGTQAEFLAKRYFWVSAGDLIRDEIRKKTPKAKAWDRLISKGTLIPDEDVLALVLKRIKGRGRVLFDGYPRSVGQARLLAHSGVPIDKVIYLDVPDRLILHRVTGRRVCSCGAVYHVKDNPPKRKGVCDVCKKPLVQRDDDTPKVVRHRLAVYNKSTKPLLEHYRKLGVLITIDGVGSITRINRDIERALSKTRAPAKRRLFIVHGWGGSPGEGWFPWLKRECEKRGFEVHALSMPDPDHPQLERWIAFLAEQVGVLDKDTYFVGHSMGCRAILGCLQRLKGTAGGAVLVAGWVSLTPLATGTASERAIAAAWLKRQTDYRKIRRAGHRMVGIFASNDPFVPLANESIYKNRLKAKTFIVKHAGHFGGDDGMKSFPLVLQQLLKMTP